jgi:hypothetical protein
MPNINFSEINWLAVAVAGFAAFMLGGLWYTALFGKSWQAAHGFTDEQIKKAQADLNPGMFFGLMLVCYMVLALGIAIVARWAGVATLTSGAGLGAIISITLILPVVLTNHLPSMVRLPGFLIDAAFNVVSCVLIGAILGVWR